MMQYKQKLTVLCSVCGALLLIYILTFVFDAEKMDAHNASWQIISEKSIANASKIEISGSDSVKLVRDGNLWTVAADNNFLLPAKQNKVKDFLAALSKPAPYPVRSTKGDPDTFGLGEDAKHIILSAGEGAEAASVLLNLKIGNIDSTGKNIYINIEGENTVRSGTDIFSQYINSSLNTWEDLRFFPTDESQKNAKGLTNADIQRISVYQIAGAEGEKSSSDDFVLVREGKGWKFENSDDAVDTSKADAYVSGILDTSADGFSTAFSPTDAAYAVSGKVPGRIVVESGDGQIYTITLGPKDGEKTTAAVSSVKFVFTLPQWTINKLWQTADSLK